MIEITTAPLAHWIWRLVHWYPTTSSLDCGLIRQPSQIVLLHMLLIWYIQFKIMSMLIVSGVQQEKINPAAKPNKFLVSNEIDVFWNWFFGGHFKPSYISLGSLTDVSIFSSMKYAGLYENRTNKNHRLRNGSWNLNVPKNSRYRNRKITVSWNSGFKVDKVEKRRCSGL